MKKLICRLMMILIFAALTIPAMVAPASAKVADDLKSYAKTLASENGASVGSKLSRGSKSNQFQYNSTSASSGRGLYVVEMFTTVAYERVAGPGSNCHMDFSLFYLGSDNKVYWTDDFNYNDRSEDFMDHTAAMRANQSDWISLQLPASCKKILAVYFHKAGGPVQGPYEWAASYLRVAKVSGSIGSIAKDEMGYEYRNYSGVYMAGIANLKELNFNGWGNHLWRLNQPSDAVNNSCGRSVFALELVTGGDGYVNKNGTVTVNYTDSLGITSNRSIRLREGYGNVQYNSDVYEAEKNYDHSLTTSWFDTSVKEMQGLAAGYTGNYWTYQGVSETLLRPYTGTGLLLVMPQNISTINSITVKLDENDSLSLQSIRFIELETLGGNYWNGGFALERTRSWTGRVLAQSAGSEYTVNGKSSFTFRRDQTSSYGRLQTYARGKGPYVDNTGTGVGVTIQLADVLGAGVEGYLAWNSSGHADKDAHFDAYKQMDKKAGTDARQAWYNLNIFRKEAITLTIRYKDTLGATRQADIPLTTTYLTYILKENKGKLTGGNWKTWISGVFQQNENVALPVKLAEYGSLLEIRLSYGSAPAGFTSGNSGSLDTAGDPISVENICFYEGVTSSNFSSKYDTKKLACVLKTSLKPAYSYSASSSQGQQLASGSTLSASLDAGTLKKGPPKSRDYAGKYLVSIKTVNLEPAGTASPISIQLDYTDVSGLRQTTPLYSVSTLAAGHYGTAYRQDKSYDLAPASYQYERHMCSNCVCEFVVDIPDAASIDSATLSIEGADEWQMESITIYSLSSLEQRRGERSNSAGLHLYWQRDYAGREVATARMSVLLYANSSSRTINFTTYAEDGTPIEPDQGVKADEYLTSLPESMTYSDTRKNLGLSVVKHIYQVDVAVADVEDAGSTNYFYFQLVFENGASGVVLANQQLASDSFRRGMVESFQIKTTQNYGNVLSVRIICDNTSSQSNVFDKLNIDSITVTLKNDSGISKSWLVERVGWIDITYVDEGAETGLDELDALMDTDSASSNVDVLKEFAITRRATAVDLLFCISTANGSANDAANPLENALQGKFEATLIYRDSAGMEKTQNFDLTAQIKAYNDTDRTFWLYRPNHVDRFTLSMPDVTSVIALNITRSGGKGTWIIDNVSIQQIGGLGEVYLSPTLSEYFRDASNASDLAKSTNSEGVNYTISGGGNVSITFTENSIDVSSQEEQDSWSATISRVPVLTSETLNIYLLPGSVIGRDYAFTPASPAVRATVKYTTVYGGAPVQNSFVLGSLGELNGQTVLYGKNLEVSAMSSLSSLVLSSTVPSGDQTIIGSAIIERCRGGVLMGTYYFNFGNFYLSNGNPEFSPTTTVSPTAMHQTLRLQPAAGQSVSLTAESNDVAVALRYTSTLDPAANKTVYQSPYVYLTDAGYTSITTGKFIDIPFELSNVGEIVGISIVTTGPVVSFDNALARSYAGPAPGAEAESPAGDTPAALLDSWSLSTPFTANTMASVYTEEGQLVTPAVFRFVTAPEEANAGAGTSGMVSMTVCYADSAGAMRSMQFDDLLSYLPSGGSLLPGSTAELSLQLSDAAYLDHIVLSAEDSWLLSSVSAELSPPGGTPSQSSATVNNWARSGAPLTIDLLPALYGGSGEGNQIQTFTVTGRGDAAQVSSSAAATGSSGGALQVTAYAGDTVRLTPAVTAVGNPDTTWTWNAGGYERELVVDSANNAAFRIPDSMAPGSSATFSVACNGDKRLAVSITVAVVKRPEPEPDEADLP